MARLPKLWWVREEGEDSPHLTDDSRGAYESCEPAKVAELDSYDIADYLDQRAESENRHDFVGVHAAVAKLVRRHADDGAADAVMLDVLRAGGLWKTR